VYVVHQAGHQGPCTSAPAATAEQFIDRTSRIPIHIGAQVHLVGRVRGSRPEALRPASARRCRRQRPLHRLPDRRLHRPRPLRHLPEGSEHRPGGRPGIGPPRYGQQGAANQDRAYEVRGQPLCRRVNRAKNGICFATGCQPIIIGNKCKRAAAPLEPHADEHHQTQTGVQGAHPARLGGCAHERPAPMR
jgi:hypothetical protein